MLAMILLFVVSVICQLSVSCWIVLKGLEVCAHLIQYGMMIQGDVDQTPVHNGTQTEALPINLSDNLCWALLEKKNGENQ